MPTNEGPAATAAEDRDALVRAFSRALLHRWFVQYNPLYLLSAALVLGGLTLVARELAEEGSALELFGVAAVAELYALALIGGAALLVRLGLRRPAVMLALLAVLYQGDLTLHVETCAHLGAAGRIAAGAWVVLFVGKLALLAAALELRLSRSAIAVPALGARSRSTRRWRSRARSSRGGRERARSPPCRSRRRPSTSRSPRDGSAPPRARSGGAWRPSRSASRSSSDRSAPPGACAGRNRIS